MKRAWDKEGGPPINYLTEMERRELIETLDELCATFGEDFHSRVAIRVRDAYRMLGAESDV